MNEESIILAETWVEKLRFTNSLTKGTNEAFLPIPQEAHEAILAAIKESGRQRRAVISYPNLAVSAALTSLSLSAEDLRGMIELISVGNLQSSFRELLDHPSCTREVMIELIFTFSQRLDSHLPSTPGERFFELECAMRMLEGFKGATYEHFKTRLDLMVKTGPSALETYQVLWSDLKKDIPFDLDPTFEHLAYNQKALELAEDAFNAAIYFAN